MDCIPDIHIVPLTNITEAKVVDNQHRTQTTDCERCSSATHPAGEGNTGSSREASPMHPPCNRRTARPRGQLANVATLWRGGRHQPTTKLHSVVPHRAAVRPLDPKVLSRRGPRPTFGPCDDLAV